VGPETVPGPGTSFTGTVTLKRTGRRRSTAPLPPHIIYRRGSRTHRNGRTRTYQCNPHSSHYTIRGWDPVPFVPPDALNVVDWPTQIVEGLAIALVGCRRTRIHRHCHTRTARRRSTAHRLPPHIIRRRGSRIHRNGRTRTYLCTPTAPTIPYEAGTPSQPFHPMHSDVVDWPAQIVEGFALALVGAVELVFTVTVTLAQPVGVPQPPSRLT
jgi:hypothetical protein